MTPANLQLAKLQISSKRLNLDEQLAKMLGMEYFLSCVTVMKSNTKSSTVQASQTENFPGVAYFLVYRASEACNENKIFALLHNADMEPTITKIRTTTAASSVFQVLKDHANEAVQSLVSTSNSYCFDRAAAELNREETVVEPTNPLSYPTKPCRIVVVNEDEHLTQIMDAYIKSYNRMDCLPRSYRCLMLSKRVCLQIQE